MFSHMLDTNIVIYVIKRRPLEVLEAFNRYAGKMVISSITYGELVHGWRKALVQRLTPESLKILSPDWTFSITAPKRHRTMAISGLRWNARERLLA
ncbi:tRNA(fMet)-specific endonuclease VapC [Serratia marcescens]|uniref:PIN domain-containing protein n=1 Tax=Serratia marcescens TaxID=615 RepID=UPI00217AD666|nr:PIN domain-containing protein [Serratia marcescens]CAI1705271.1 tRNA(fMet)-specific endonuclease VapC [Serratia marcescens]